MPRLSCMRPGFLRRWIVVVTAGEAVGFAVPAVVGALLFDESAWILVPALLTAGAIEVDSSAPRSGGC